MSPLGNDPTPTTELEREFGLSGSADDLIMANRARYPAELRAALRQDEHPVLAADFRPDSDDYEANLKKLADHVDTEVESATVRGQGPGAVITYTFLDDRGSIEKGLVPYAEVFGSAAARRASRRARADAESPDEAGERAAQAKLDEAEVKAQERATEAQAEAEKLIADARAEAAQITADAQAKAEADRAKAAEEAAAAAEKAKAAAEKAKAK